MSNKRRLSPMSRYWISWHQPGEDYRPLTYPPNERVLGWWRSGETGENAPRSILCAVVMAQDEEDAKRAISLDWSEAEDWRFTESVSSNFTPGDRFPPSDWMEARL